MPTRFLWVFCMSVLLWLDVNAQSLPPEHVVLNWDDAPETSQNVTWRTLSPATDPVAEIALATAVPYDTVGLRTIGAEVQPVTTLEGEKYTYYTAYIKGLKPNTLYRYRVGSEQNGFSAWYQFTTAAEPPAPFSFLYVGDIQNDIRSWGTRTVWEAFKKAPDARFMLFAGDCVDHGHSASEWNEWFGMLGQISAQMPIVPVTGNHEYDPLHPDAEDESISLFWQPQFALPKNGPEGMEESVYYIDYPDMRLIVLNSLLGISNEEALRRQTEWLRSVLENNPQKWTVVSFHHPFFSARDGSHGDYPSLREYWWPLLEEYKVDLALMGHDHMYGRSSHQRKNITVPAGYTGPVYVVSIAGPKMYGMKTEKRWMDRAAVNAQLYQVVTINGDTLEFRTYTVANTLYDSFTLYKTSEGYNRIEEQIISSNTSEHTFPDGRYTYK